MQTFSLMPYAAVCFFTLLWAAGFTQPEALREMPRKVEEQGFAGVVMKARSLFQQVQQDPFYAVVSYKNSKPLKR